MTDLDALTDGGMEAVPSLGTQRFLSETFRQQNPVQTRLIREMVAKTPTAGYIDSGVELRDADLRRIAPPIQLPSLVIGGELDEAAPVA
jgi:3-oxoadipate enol-lactonase